MKLIYYILRNKDIETKYNYCIFWKLAFYISKHISFRLQEKSLYAMSNYMLFTFILSKHAIRVHDICHFYLLACKWLLQIPMVEFAFVSLDTCVFVPVVFEWKIVESTQSATKGQV